MQQGECEEGGCHGAQACCSGPAAMQAGRRKRAPHAAMSYSADQAQVDEDALQLRRYVQAALVAKAKGSSATAYNK